MKNGETETKEYYSSTIFESSYYVYTKYNSKDNLHTLEPGDDAAHVKLGGSWRMPTIQECKELISGCKCTFIANYNGTGVNGLLATGDYWCSFLMYERPYAAWHIHFDIDNESMEYNSRELGYTIRPVCPKD